MKPQDPFLTLLEDSLAAPDFDLGTDLRGRLLAAAAESERSPDVIEFVSAEAVDVSAFNWLVGEEPTGADLLGRLMASPPFAAAVAGQQQFLRVLRRSLRPVEVTLESPVRGRSIRNYLYASAAVAAAILLMFFLMPSASGGKSTGVIATSEAPTPTDKQEKSEGARSTTGSQSVSGFAERSRATPGAFGEFTSHQSVDVVRNGGGVLRLDEATRLAARELFQDGSKPFGMDSIPIEPPMELALAEGQGGVASKGLISSAGDWMYGSPMVSRTEDFSTGLNGVAVPEPSGCLLMAIGTMAMLLRRRRSALPDR